MGKELQLSFKVGQLAEARSFQNGFRGAWFRCKIKEITRRGGQWNALLEYFDYPDEKMRWLRLYQFPPYRIGKSKEKRQLMLRPQYPSVKLKNEVSDFSPISDATIVVDGIWQVGDLIDWWANDCYWSGQLTKLLADGKAEMALTPPPMGEGIIYEVSFEDIRPSLDWSPEFGWIVPTTSQDGERVRCCAKLIQPNQALGHFPILEIHSALTNEGRKDSQETAGFSSNASLPIHLSANLLPASDEKRDLETTEFAEHPIIDISKEAANTSSKVSWSGNDSGSCSVVGTAKPSRPTENLYHSSCPLKRLRTSSGIQLHSMGSDSMEAAILDLEELANKIKWLKGIIELGHPLSDADRPSWEFVEHRASPEKK